MLIVGAPPYLAQHGMPATPQALLGHNRLGANYVRTRSGWPLRDAGEELVVPFRATPRPAMARRCAVWPWPAWAWRGWPRSRCART